MTIEEINNLDGTIQPKNEKEDPSVSATNSTDETVTDNTLESVEDAPNYPIQLKGESDNTLKDNDLQIIEAIDDAVSDSVIIEGLPILEIIESDENIDSVKSKNGMVEFDGNPFDRNSNEAEAAIEPENDGTITMSVRLREEEYAILKNEYPLFGVDNDDSFLRFLVLGREDILNMPKVRDFLKKEDPSVSAAENGENATLDTVIEQADIDITPKDEITTARYSLPTNKTWATAFIVLLVLVILAIIYWAWKAKKGKGIEVSNGVKDTVLEAAKKVVTVFNTNGLDI